MHKAQFPEESEGYTAFAAVTAAVASIETLSPSKQTGRRTSKVERLAAKRVLVANVLGHDELLMNSWKQDRHVEFVGKSTPPVATEPSPVAPSAADQPLRSAS